MDTDTIICTTDSKGRTMWLAATRRALDRYAPGLKERGEKYRISQRTISALGGSATVYVLTIIGR